jgi:hypothetical protein
MVFAALETPVIRRGEMIKENGCIKTKVVYREGINGTGVTLPFICGFCRDKGRPTEAFRSRRQRNNHTNRCLK